MDFQFATSVEIMRELGLRLRTHRLANSMTQDELSTRAGVALGSIKTLESKGSTTFETFVRVVQALSLVSELETLLLLKTQTSIADMERAELTRRVRAPRRSLKPAP